MARPLATWEVVRGAANGAVGGRPESANREPTDPAAPPPTARPNEELEAIREENDQLRALCAELEQALQEAAAHHGGASLENQLKEYEQLLEEKSEVIRQLHQQIQELQQAPKAAPAPEPHKHNRGPRPREDELLALSEELERERRQLQEDEESLMEQMRQMEVSMARERAELARQRNDLQRLQSEIRHEMDRLERNGALQSKMESLKNKFNDASARRGASPGQSQSTAGPAPAAPAQTPPPASPSRKDSIVGFLFRKDK
jgi:hypothetical protein